MKTNIDHVTQLYWNSPVDGKTCWCYKVFYKKTPRRLNGICKEYTWKDNLPYSVLEFIVGAETCETTYFPREHSIVYKRETYR